MTEKRKGGQDSVSWRLGEAGVASPHPPCPGPAPPEETPGCASPSPHLTVHLRLGTLRLNLLPYPQHSPRRAPDLRARLPG